MELSKQIDTKGMGLSREMRFPSVKLLTGHHLKFLSLKGGCKSLSESTLVKLPHYWKSHVTAHIIRATGQNFQMFHFA